MDQTDTRAAVAEAARRLAAEGLLIGTAGNVSARHGDLVAVTGTGVVLGTCGRDDVTLVSSDGTVVEGALVPTSELELHLMTYAATRAAAVVHTHAPFSTAVACALDELPVLHYQQLALGGTIRVAPYATFGSPDLAAAVSAAIAGRQAALMANHGSVAIGATLEKAVDNALLLEWLATLHHRVAALGEPRPLTEQQQLEVIEAALRTGYGSTHRNPEEAP